MVLGEIALHTRATGRRSGSIEELNELISQVKIRRLGTAYQKAKAEACKLMGIPNLESKEYVLRHRVYHTKLNLLVKKVAELIATIRETNVTVISMVDKKQLKDINTRILALNEYRETNPFLYANLPQLASLDIQQLEGMSNFFYLVPVKSCGFGECPKHHAKTLEIPLSDEANKIPDPVYESAPSGKEYYCPSDRCCCGLPKSWDKAMEQYL